MSGGTSDDFCEEPGADFFDTFFDDGVLDVIRDVHQNPDSENADTSEAPHANVANSNEGNSTENQLSAFLDSQSSVGNPEESTRNKQESFISKPAYSKDRLKQSGAERKEKRIVEQDVSQVPKESSECRSDHVSITSRESFSSSTLKDQRELASHLLARVGKIIDDIPNIMINDQSTAGINNEKNKPVTSGKEFDVAAIVKRCLADPPAVRSATEKEALVVSEIRKKKENKVNNKQLPTECLSKDLNDLAPDIWRKEDKPVDTVCKLHDGHTTVSIPSSSDILLSVDVKKKDDKIQMACKTDHLESSSAAIRKDLKDATRSVIVDESKKLCSHATNAEKDSKTKEATTKDSSKSSGSKPFTPVTSASNSCTEMKSKPIRDETEKENDLSLEDTVSKTPEQKISPEKQNKIKLNLKTQILAPTSTLNSGSSSKAEQSLFKPVTKKNSKTSSKTFRLRERERRPSLSSVSDDSLPVPESPSASSPPYKKKKSKKRKKRERSLSGDSDFSDSVESTARSPGKGGREKKMKRRSDSQEARRSRNSKKSRDSRRRSRSRPRSPRSRSPHVSKRRDKREKSPRLDRLNRRSRRSNSRSSSSRRSYRRSRSPRHRTRSSSSSPAHHPTWRAPRSRSKSPFMNQVQRMKAEWARLDEAKRCYQPPSEVRAAQPRVWPQETTIMGGTLSVSEETVHVQRTSFTFGSSVNISQSISEGLPPAAVAGFSPFASSFVQPPGYNMWNNNSQYTVPVPPYNCQNDAGREIQLPVPPGLSPPQLATPPLFSAVSSMPDAAASASSADPQRSLFLRRQLDILKTVATLAEPHSSLGNMAPLSTLRNPGASNGGAVYSALVPISLQPEKLDMNVSSLENSENLVSEVVTAPPLEPTVHEAIPEVLQSEKVVVVGVEKLPERERGSTETNVPAVAIQQPSCNDETGSLETKEPLTQKLESETYNSEKHVEEHYDSDIIVEEPPPRAPVEIICLSEDEGDGNVVYDVPMEAKEVYEDIHSPDHLELVEDVAVIKEPNTKQASKKKKKKKRYRSHKEYSRDETPDRAVDHPRSGENVDDGIEESIGGSDDSRDSILKECREMIDSLRSGRFVLVDDPPEDSANRNEETSNFLLAGSKVEFLYTRKPNLELISKTRDVSTNTPFRLLIDVCCSTESSVPARKDFITQTDFDCLGCNEKKVLLKDLHTQLQNLKKERDELLSIVLDVGKCQAIPGLTNSSDGIELSTRMKVNKFISNEIVSSNDSSTQVIHTSPRSSSKSWHSPSVRATSSIPELMRVNASCEPQAEPVVAYEYNHSSPVRPGIQSHAKSDEFYCPKRPFQ